MPLQSCWQLRWESTVLGEPPSYQVSASLSICGLTINDDYINFFRLRIKLIFEEIEILNLITIILSIFFDVLLIICYLIFLWSLKLVFYVFQLLIIRMDSFIGDLVEIMRSYLTLNHVSTNTK